MDALRGAIAPSFAIRPSPSKRKSTKRWAPIGRWAPSRQTCHGPISRGSPSGLVGEMDAEAEFLPVNRLLDGLALGRAAFETKGEGFTCDELTMLLERAGELAS